jgi:hypothetical protein
MGVLKKETWEHAPSGPLARGAPHGAGAELRAGTWNLEE